MSSYKRTDQELWNDAVYKGSKLLDAMAGDERRAGSLLNPPKESGEAEFQNYSKYHRPVQSNLATIP